jgi:hypothetical protein
MIAYLKLPLILTPSSQLLLQNSLKPCLQLKVQTTCWNILEVFIQRENLTTIALLINVVSEAFVYEELFNLKISKSTGLDNISARFARAIKMPIPSVINQSIFSGIVPNSMKQARVKLLYKKGSPLHVGNYRPVSTCILSVVSKILEKSAYVQLKDFLQRNKMLYKSGFRSKFSTDTCLIHLLQARRNRGACPPPPHPHIFSTTKKN